MKSKALLFTALFLTLLGFLTAEIIEKPIVIVIPSYNNKRWYSKNLNSACFQNYKNYRVIYVDDCSPDNTGFYVKRYIKKNKLEGKVTLWINKERRGALYNLYYAIHSCDDNEIIVTLDGDDWLKHPNVLKQLNEIYSTHDVWITHGRFVEYPSGISAWSEKIPDGIVENNDFRKFKCASHLRTFYAWLFKKIKKEDLLYNGDFFQMTWDMAMMYPMLEMAGERQVYVDRINYVYNMINPINDNKVDAEYQRFLDSYIREMEPYIRLESGIHESN